MSNPDDAFVLPGVRELTVRTVLNKYASRRLPLFLHQLFAKHHVGRSLRKVQIAAKAFDALLLLYSPLNDTTSAGDVDFFIGYSPAVPRSWGITHLSVQFMPERDFSVVATAVNTSLSHLFRSLASTLSSFSLSYASYPNRNGTRPSSFDRSRPHQLHLSQVMKALPYLPALKEISFEAPFTQRTIGLGEVLTEWLRQYEGQLERLTIRPTILRTNDILDDSDSDSPSHFVSYGIYPSWLLGSCFPGFCCLRFPRLHSLEIRGGVDRTAIIPALSTITPSLKSLTFCSNHRADNISRLVHGLPELREGYSGLETLCLHVNLLSLNSLEILHASAKFSGLKSLEVNCTNLNVVC